MNKTKVAPTPAEVLHIDVTVHDGEAVCRLAGELDSISGPALRVVLNEQLDAGRDAVIELSALRFIDSSGIGVLVGVLKRFQATDRRLALRAPNATLRRVLDMTGLTGAFPIE